MLLKVSFKLIQFITNVQYGHQQTKYVHKSILLQYLKRTAHKTSFSILCFNSAIFLTGLFLNKRCSSHIPIERNRQAFNPVKLEPIESNHPYLSNCLEKFYLEILARQYQNEQALRLFEMRTIERILRNLFTSGIFK